MTLGLGELACVWYNTDSFYGYVEATSSCVSQGSHLVSVKTPDKLAFIKRLVGSGEAWVGLDDLETQGTYIWACDGEVLTSQQIVDVFSPGKPDDYQGRQDCVDYRGHNGMLDDNECQVQRNFICEKDLPSEN